ncbi:hypothetical protein YASMINEVIRUS_1287 [Yasminevirus sp. GU-2018]|uniref:AAA+ ATPase domain-containing protein n=1 Tax=Yasminevirus sp. GU-2018 TaxID=2420051 RepID=A0A5K0UAK9_9VIRU|nr:hypothetical protein YASMINEVIRUS_1287 [Yasminevirus sp. GU-2018]
MNIKQSFTHFDFCELTSETKEKPRLNDPRCINVKNPKYLERLNKAVNVTSHFKTTTLIITVLEALPLLEVYETSSPEAELSFIDLINLVRSEFGDDISIWEKVFVNENRYNFLTVSKIFKKGDLCIGSDSVNTIEVDAKSSKTNTLHKNSIAGCMVVDQYYSFFGKLFQSLCYVLIVEQIDIRHGKFVKLKKKVILPLPTGLTNYKNIKDLAIIKINDLPKDKADIVTDLLRARGNKFMTIYPELKVFKYSGYGWAIDRWTFSEDLAPERTIKIDSKVVIDSEYFQKMNKSFCERFDKFSLKSLLDFTAPQEVTIEHVSTSDMSYDELYYNSDVCNSLMMCCNSRVFGYAFDVNKWVVMFVDNIQLSNNNFTDSNYSDIVRTTTSSCLDALVIDPTKIKMMTGIVANHFTKVELQIPSTTSMLLYGPPGTGKTMTAKLIGEYYHKPVLDVNVGDLYGGNSSQFEEKITEQFDLAKRWSCIVLLDEADVLMRKRSVNDTINDNVTVAVFLKKIETHPGVLFLTANEITSIDKAFLSRMNLIVKYELPTENQRIMLCDSVMRQLGVNKEHRTQILKHLCASNNLYLSGRDILHILTNFCAINNMSPQDYDLTPDDTLAFLVASIKN